MDSSIVNLQTVKLFYLVIYCLCSKNSFSFTLQLEFSQFLFPFSLRNYKILRYVYFVVPLDHEIAKVRTIAYDLPIYYLVGLSVGKRLLDMQKLLFWDIFGYYLLSTCWDPLDCDSLGHETMVCPFQSKGCG